MNAVTVPQTSIKYYVTDARGQFIMTCPMSVLSKIFSFTKSVCEKVERETVALDGESKVHLNFSHFEFRTEWSPIIIRRLPIEIPQQAG